MRFRLDAAHVIQDIQLDSGTEIGDDTPYAFRDAKGDFTVVPSAAMTPLDGEAATAYGKIREEKAKAGVTWGNPEAAFPILGTPASPPVIGRTTNPNSQPIIPAPIEHLLRPNDMRPNEVGDRQNPLIAEALEKQNERMAADAAKRDEEQARKANDRDEAMKRDRLAGMKSPAPGIAPQPPAATSTPRDSNSVTSTPAFGQTVNPPKPAPVPQTQLSKK